MEDKVKLAFLYFLEHVLFEKERKTLISMQWVTFVDNLKTFNKYS